MSRWRSYGCLVMWALNSAFVPIRWYEGDYTLAVVDAALAYWMISLAMKLRRRNQ